MKTHVIVTSPHSKYIGRLGYIKGDLANLNKQITKIPVFVYLNLQDTDIVILAIKNIRRADMAEVANWQNEQCRKTGE